MFGGIDEVDWASLRHAYGPADDVPELLRGLASADPAEREKALDGMYGAVHHQGDVYDSTLACIPFLLELATADAVPDRGGIIELLTSIGGIDLDGDDELDPEDEEFEFAANYAMAASAVTAGADVFLGLLDADDRGVRLAVPFALATLHADPARVLSLLRTRLAVEPDAEVRFACVEAGGRIALRHGELAAEVVDWLSGLTRASYDAGLRLAALAQLARCAPEALPHTVVPCVTSLLRELRADPVVFAVPVAERTPSPPAERSVQSAERSVQSAAERSSLAERSAAPEWPASPAWPGPPGRSAAPDRSGPHSRSGPQDRSSAYERSGPHDRADAQNGTDTQNGTGAQDGTDAQGRTGHHDQNAPHDRAAPHGQSTAQERRSPTEERPPARPERPGAHGPDERPSSPPTLLSGLRQARAADTAGRGAPPWTADLLRTLHAGLGDRVDDRIALLADQLCSPDWGQRIDAVRMSSALLRTWRGAYDELVCLIGEQLADPEPRLADAAVDTLAELFSLAAPAADALADRVAADPAGRVRSWPGGPVALGGALTALARTGDRRAAPALARMLELAEPPQGLGHALGHLGAAAGPLVPALCARLGALPLDDRLYDRAAPLLHAVTELRAADALPEVLRVLRGAPEHRREWVVECALRALTAFGPAAEEAAPELRRLLRDPSPSLAALAAQAVWAVEHDAGAALGALRAALEASQPLALRSAAAALGTLGPAAAEVAGELGALLRSPEPGIRVDAAQALWRVTGDRERAWPVLLTAWDEMPHTRVPIAECLAELRARGVQRLLLAELTAVRRHNALDSGYGSHDIFTDEKLLALCRRALSRG
ncbi:PBS lyase [Streptomyces sp. MUM 178J]|uniref:PBS lyase n=1 Tax=Streptomyces sp. MUM 178J TaxID=2791991 RepID=UPI001F045E63|nr:PBS lyase [Streptomyces sp. MUM 178J]WRQ81297.1 PBS lyase [Streptomyces sp. MUM 178J]